MKTFAESRRSRLASKRRPTTFSSETTGTPLNRRTSPRATIPASAVNSPCCLSLDGGPTVRKQVLYPYDLNNRGAQSFRNPRTPKTFAYLEQHREQLESRKYVIESGRQWFEIWVPHQPRIGRIQKLSGPILPNSRGFFSILPARLSTAIVTGSSSARTLIRIGCA